MNKIWRLFLKELDSRKKNKQEAKEREEHAAGHHWVEQEAHAQMLGSFLQASCKTATDQVPSPIGLVLAERQPELQARGRQRCRRPLPNAACGPPARALRGLEACLATTSRLARRFPPPCTLPCAALQPWFACDILVVYTVELHLFYASYV